MSSWYVYILRCADHSLYTGVTTDPERRLREHNGNNKRGAAYTRGRRPVVQVYLEEVSSRSTATKREYEIRKLNRHDKENLIAGQAA